MNFGLEQVDQVIARTGVSYQKAKEALAAVDGDVLEAIIYLETSQEYDQKQSQNADAEWDDVKEKVNFGENTASHIGSMAEDIVDFFKDIIRQGNINRIMVVKGEKIIVNIPITAGAFGAVFFAPATIISIIVALATGCELRIIKEDGEVIDIKDITKESLEKVREKVNPDNATCQEEDGSCSATDAEQNNAENKEEENGENVADEDDGYEEVK